MALSPYVDPPAYAFDGIVDLDSLGIHDDAQSLHLVLEVAESVSSADGIDHALNRLAWLALRATGADRSAILVPDPRDAFRIQPAAGAARIGDLSVLWDRFRSMDPIDIRADLQAPTIWHTTEATIIEDVALSDVIPESWKQAWESKSIAYAPLRAAGEVFGVLAVDYITESHRFSSGEVKVLEAIASAAGVALRSAALVERLQHSIAVERRLSECSAALLAGTSLEDVLDEIAERFASLLPDSACGINLLDAHGTGFRLAAWRGLAPRTHEVRIEDLPESEVRQIRTIWDSDPRFVIRVPRVGTEWAPFVPDGIGSGMLVPLVEGRETLGFVAVGRAAGGFTDDEIRVASAFADQAALALMQARLTEAVQLRLRLVEALSRLEETVLRASDLRSVLRTLNRKVGGEIGVECTRLSFADASLAELLRAPSATSDELDRIRTWRRDRDPAEGREGGLLAIPVRVHGRVAGILWVRAEPIDAVRLELVRAMAATIGEVAHKAKLRRKAEQVIRELAVATDRERIARDLHDTVGQTFYGIGLTIQDLLYDVTDPVLREKLGALRVMASRGVADVRSAVYALSFVHLRDRGLLRSIQTLAHEFTEATGIDVQVRVEGELPHLRDDVESVLYRVAHEALANVDRHARATGVVLSIRAHAAAVEMSIRDDGVGLAQREARDWRVSAHFGMRMMAKSVDDLGGRFQARPMEPRGFLIQASVPTNPSGSKRGGGG